MTEGKAIRLEYRPVKDETTKYSIQVRSEQVIREQDRSSPISLWMEMKVSQRVIEILSDSQFRVEYTIDFGAMEKGGVECPFPSSGKMFTLDMKKNGEVVGSSFTIPFSQPTFPEEDISPGSTWTRISEVMVPFAAQIPQATEKGSVPLTYEYTLSEIIEMDDLEYAVIEVTTPETHLQIGPDIESVMSAEGKIYFSHREGKLLRFRNETTSTIKTGDAEIHHTVTSSMEME